VKSRGLDPGSRRGPGFSGASKAQRRPGHAPAASRGPMRGKKRPDQAGAEPHGPPRPRGDTHARYSPPRTSRPLAVMALGCGHRPDRFPHQFGRPGDCPPAAFPALDQTGKALAPRSPSPCPGRPGLSGMVPMGDSPRARPKGRARGSGPGWPLRAPTASPPRGLRGAKSLAPWRASIPKGPRAKGPIASWHGLALGDGRSWASPAGKGGDRPWPRPGPPGRGPIPVTNWRASPGRAPRGRPGQQGNRPKGPGPRDSLRTAGSLAGWPGWPSVMEREGRIAGDGPVQGETDPRPGLLADPWPPSPAGHRSRAGTRPVAGTSRRPPRPGPRPMGETAGACPGN
jgi:hypothetical protein